jgi:hypothetical protein
MLVVQARGVKNVDDQIPVKVACQTARSSTKKKEYVNSNVNIGAF